MHLQEIRAAARITTHMWAHSFLSWKSTHPIFFSVPHYHVVSRKVNAGFMSRPISFLRAFLIEGLYLRLGRFFHVLVDLICADTSFFTATMFPETANWLTPADEYVYHARDLHSELTCIASESFRSALTPSFNYEHHVPGVTAEFLFIFLGNKYMGSCRTIVINVMLSNK